MDQSSISPAALYASIGTAAAPIVLDVRRERDFHDDGTMIAGGIRRSPEDVDKWAPLLSPARSAIVHCVRGGEANQRIAQALYTSCRSLQAEVHNWTPPVAAAAPPAAS